MGSSERNLSSPVERAEPPQRYCPATIAVVLLLVVHVGLLAYGALIHSPTFNEIGHLPAGISHWQFNRYDLYRVNPPLVRMVAAAPVLAMNPNTDWSSYGTHSTQQSQLNVGIDFVKANGDRSFLLYSVGRMACIPFSCLGLGVCFLWAKNLYGSQSGVLSAALWCFSPLIVGHGSLMMPDVPAASCGVLSAYLFWCWNRQPAWSCAIQCGIALGLALLTKTTLLILLPLFILIWGLTIDRHSDRPRSPLLRQFAMLATMFAISFAIVNIGYSFQGSFQPLGSYHFISRALAGQDVKEMDLSAAKNRFSGTVLGRIPVPLPADFVLGIDQQKADFDLGYPCYLRGQWQHGGWWYFYLYGLAVKAPIGTLLLLLLPLILGRFAGHYRTSFKAAVHLLVPPLAILLLASSQTSLTVHLRYIIPAIPFAFIWASRVARCFTTGHRFVSVVVATSITWTMTSSLLCYPHSIAYFNEFIGGPKRGHYHLLDSNIAWGQDILLLRKWVARHPEARPLHVATFGWIDPAVAGIDYILPPVGPVVDVPQAPNPKGGTPSVSDSGPQPGWFVIDVNHLHGSPYWAADGHGGWVSPSMLGGGYRYFSQFEPVDRIGYSLLIYHLKIDTVNIVRQQLGLPVVSGRPSH